MAKRALGKTKIIPFRPRAHELVGVIRNLASNSANVRFSAHAMERMDERDITTLDALRVLRSGDIVGDIEPGASPGEWKCKVVERRKGARGLGVVTIATHGQKLFIKTVEWEDK